MRNIISQTVPLQFDTGFSPYHAVAWQAAFSSLCAHGFTGVEIAVAYPQLIDVDALNNCAKENKLKITTISTGQTYGRDGIYLASMDEGIRMRAMDIVRQHIDLSAKIGHPNVTIGLLRGRPKQISTRRKQFYRLALRSLRSMPRKTMLCCKSNRYAPRKLIFEHRRGCDAFARRNQTQVTVAFSLIFTMHR